MRAVAELTAHAPKSEPTVAIDQVRREIGVRQTRVRRAAAPSDSARRGWVVLNANLVALGAAFVSLMLQGPRPLSEPRYSIPFLIGGAFVLSRWLGMRSGLRSAVIVLDAI